jgi:hypothetical protein
LPFMPFWEPRWPMSYPPTSDDSPLHILLDLDGVLVDFVRGSCEALGLDPLPPAEVRWNFYEQLGLSGEEFWPKLGKDFWAGLPWTEEGPSLVEALESSFPKESIAILSSPCRTPGCAEGKIAWIEKNLPQYVGRYFLGTAKYFLAGPRKILLDDYDRNVENFTRNGGVGVLTPRPWNRASQRCDGKGRFSVQGVLAEMRLQARQQGYVI